MTVSRPRSAFPLSYLAPIPMVDALSGFLFVKACPRSE